MPELGQHTSQARRGLPLLPVSPNLPACVRPLRKAVGTIPEASALRMVLEDQQPGTRDGEAVAQ